MKHISILLLALAGLLTLAACGDSATYADKRQRERAIINKYLIDQHIRRKAAQRIHCNMSL